MGKGEPSLERRHGRSSVQETIDVTVVDLLGWGAEESSTAVRAGKYIFSDHFAGLVSKSASLVQLYQPQW